MRVDELVRVNFQWERPVDGFCWIDEEGPRKRKLRRLVPIGDPGPVQWEPIQPLNTPHLLREFAELDPTEEAVQKFANSYGPLTEGSWSFEVWEHEIDLIRAVLGIWDCVAEGDLRGLKKWLSRDGSVVTYVGPAFSSSRNPGLPPGSGPLPCCPFDFGRDVPSGLLDAGAEIVAMLINYNLSDDVRWDHVYIADEWRLETISQPASLRAAIWSELSKLTRGGEDQRRCAQCGTWFTIEVGQKRFDSRYDTDACKSTAYRERKKTAKRMKERGLGIREIAKALDSETAVVRGWIDPTKRVSKPKTKIDRLRARQRVMR